MGNFLSYNRLKRNFYRKLRAALPLIYYASIKKNDRMSMHIQFLTTGGTIDKIYFDALSQFEVGDSQVKAILTDALADFRYEVTAIMKKIA